MMGGGKSPAGRDSRSSPFGPGILRVSSGQLTRVQNLRSKREITDLGYSSREHGDDGDFSLTHVRRVDLLTGLQ